MNKKYKSFEDSRLFGEQGQERVADALREAGAFANKVDDRSRYDFELQFNNHTFRVEVKNEDNYRNGDNICVETRQGRSPRPSGISTSEATMCVHTLGDNCVIYLREKMLTFLRAEVATGRQYEQKFGDNYNRGFILSITDMNHQWWFDYCMFTEMAESELWQS